MSTTIPILDTKNVNAHFDVDTCILRVSYYGVLDGDSAVDLHTWIEQMRETIGPRPIEGVIFDLRKVIRFKRDNLYTTAEQSQQLQQQINRRCPIALIVSTYYQEQMVQVMMLTATDADMRQVVYSEEEAFYYITQGYAEQDS
jgi:hypothetical protein